jgi:hypothetical protein
MSIEVGGSSSGRVITPPFHAFDDVGASGGAFVFHPDGSMGATSPAFWGNILGGGHGFASPSGGGGIRARNSNGAGVGARTDILDWRMGQRFSINNPSILVVRQRKFTFQCGVTANGNGPEIAIKMDPNTFATANTILGYGLGVVAGNWAGIRRIVTGAASTVVPVLQSLSAAIWRRVRFEFTEGPVPLIECFMDNLLLYSVSGESNMPELTVPFATTYGPAVTATAAVTILTTAAEMTMEYR